MPKDPFLSPVVCFCLASGDMSNLGDPTSSYSTAGYPKLHWSMPSCWTWFIIGFYKGGAIWGGEEEYNCILL